MKVSHWYDGESGTFTYLVDDDAGACAVIDPVLSYDPLRGRTRPETLASLLDAVEGASGPLQWTLETHIHADHLTAAQLLKRQFGGEVGAGARVVDDWVEFAHLFDLKSRPEESFDRLFADGELFRIGRLNARALHVPGHTAADVAYLVEDPSDGHGALFVGDTLFAPDLGTARCDFPGASAASLFASIKRMLALPDAYDIFLCHDYPPPGRATVHRTTVAEQRALNVHLGPSATLEAFVEQRSNRDRELGMPQLMVPALQFNLMAGRTPHFGSDGGAYLRIPLDRF